MKHSIFIAYQQKLEACEVAFEKIDFEQEKGYTVKLAIFSANLTNFMPHLPQSEHETMFRQMLKNVAFESFDRKVLHLSDCTEFKGNTDLLLPSPNPRIFCAFHLGSYRAIANILIRNGVHFSTLVRQEIYAQEMESFRTYTAQMNEKYGNNSQVGILNAEDPGVLLKIIREFKQGRSLLVYLDGNTGTGTSDEKLELVPFLDQFINVKKGMAYLSYVSGAPLVPVVAYRKADYGNVLCVENPIYPDKTQSREEFSQQTLRKLFHTFGNYVYQYPSQWEAWNYVQNFLPALVEEAPKVVAGLYQKPTYKFNKTRYCLFDLEQSAVLFDKKQYMTYEISDDLRDYLAETPFTKPQLTLGKTVFRDLVSRQILV